MGAGVDTTDTQSSVESKSSGFDDGSLSLTPHSTGEFKGTGLEKKQGGDTDYTPISTQTVVFYNRLLDFLTIFLIKNKQVFHDEFILNDRSVNYSRYGGALVLISLSEELREKSRSAGAKIRVAPEFENYINFELHTAKHLVENMLGVAEDNMPNMVFDERPVQAFFRMDEIIDLARKNFKEKYKQIAVNLIESAISVAYLTSYPTRLFLTRNQLAKTKADATRYQASDCDQLLASAMGPLKASITAFLSIKKNGLSKEQTTVCLNFLQAISELEKEIKNNIIKETRKQLEEANEREEKLSSKNKQLEKTAFIAQVRADLNTLNNKGYSRLNFILFIILTPIGGALLWVAGIGFKKRPKIAGKLLNLCDKTDSGESLEYFKKKALNLFVEGKNKSPSRDKATQSCYEGLKRRCQ